MNLFEAKWLKYVVIAFIIYAIMQQKPGTFTAIKDSVIDSDVTKAITAPPLEINEKIAGAPETTYIERKVAGVITAIAENNEGKQFLRNLIQTKNTDNSKINYVMELGKYISTTEDIKVGTGDIIAKCGHHVTFSHNQIEKEAIIGNKETKYYIELGLIGMKPTGERKLLLPNGESELINLINIKNNSQFENVVSFDTKHSDSNIIAMCGDKVRISYIIKTLDGNNIKGHENYKILDMKIGASQVPYALSENIIGMNVNSQKEIIMTPKFQKDINNNIIVDFLPKNLHNTPLLVQITLTDVIK
jgi:hypothetical protein